MKLSIHRVSLDLTNAYIKNFDIFSKNDVYFSIYDGRSRMHKSTVKKNAKGYLYSWEYNNSLPIYLSEKSSLTLHFFDKDFLFDDNITKVPFFNAKYVPEYNEDLHKLFSFVDKNNATIEVEFTIKL